MDVDVLALLWVYRPPARVLDTDPRYAKPIDVAEFEQIREGCAVPIPACRRGTSAADRSRTVDGHVAGILRREHRTATGKSCEGWDGRSPTADTRIGSGSLSLVRSLQQHRTYLYLEAHVAVQPVPTGGKEGVGAWQDHDPTGGAVVEGRIDRSRVECSAVATGIVVGEDTCFPTVASGSRATAGHASQRRVEEQQEQEQALLR